MYTGTFELYDEDADAVRVFVGKCERYDQGGALGDPRHDWTMELTDDIQELDESGKIVGIVEYHDPLYEKVREAIEADALERYEDAALKRY